MMPLTVLCALDCLVCAEFARQRLAQFLEQASFEENFLRIPLLRKQAFIKETGGGRAGMKEGFENERKKTIGAVKPEIRNP